MAYSDTVTTGVTGTSGPRKNKSNATNNKKRPDHGNLTSKLPQAGNVLKRR